MSNHINKKGINAFASGIELAGIQAVHCSDKDISEKLGNITAHEYVAQASQAVECSHHFATKGVRTMCILNDGACKWIREIEDGFHKHRSALVFFVFSERITGAVLKKLTSLQLDLLIVEDHIGCISMIQDAVKLSEMKRRPVVILALRNFLESLEPFYINMDPLSEKIYEYDEGFIRKMQSSHNCFAGDRRSEQLIISLGDSGRCVKYLMRNTKGVLLWNLNMIAPGFLIILWKILNEKKRDILVVGEGAGYLYEMISDIVSDMDMDMIIRYSQPNSKIQEMHDMTTAIYDFLRLEQRKSFRKDNLSGYDERYKVRRPEIEKISNVMCPGCRYRRCITRIRESDPTKKIYEEIYCPIMKVRVTSGYTTSDICYGADMIITNDKEHRYSSDKVILLEHHCQGVKKETVYKISRTKCNACHKCITQTKCPALYIKGIKVIIDNTRCVGCGDCSRYCSRRAIQEVAECPI